MPITMRWRRARASSKENSSVAPEEAVSGDLLTSLPDDLLALVVEKLSTRSRLQITHTWYREVLPLRGAIRRLSRFAATSKACYSATKDTLSRYQRRLSELIDGDPLSMRHRERFAGLSRMGRARLMVEDQRMILQTVKWFCKNYWSACAGSAEGW